MHFMKSISFYQCCICCVSILVDMSLFLLHEKEYKSTSLQSIDYLLVQKPLSYPFLFQSLYHKQHHALEAHHALQRDIFGRFLLAIFYCFNLKTHAIFFLAKKKINHIQVVLKLIFYTSTAIAPIIIPSALKPGIDICFRLTV